MKQDADRDEEQDRESVPHRQRVGRRPQAELGAAHDHPGQERPEGHRDAEELDRADGDAQGDDEHCQREEFAGPRCRRPFEEPGDEAVAEEEGQGHHHGDLDQGYDHREGHAPGFDAGGEDGREEHEHEDREEVLDDEPADGDVTGRGLQVATVGEHPHQDHGARDREG